MKSSAPASAPLSLLLIDDDAEYVDLLRTLLLQHGHSVAIARNGSAAMELLAQQSFDLLLLDVTMPGMDGFSVLHRLRLMSHTPVIMLTSRIAAGDRVRGLDGGADDYICKPCDPDELLSRIRAVLRRTNHPAVASTTYAFGSHHFDTATRLLTAASGASVHLTSLEGDLLTMLLEAKGKVVPRESIAMALQERELDVFDRSLDVHISRLRSKLAADGGLIQTMRGVGYLLPAQATGHGR